MECLVHLAVGISQQLFHIGLRRQAQANSASLGKSFATEVSRAQVLEMPLELSYLS